MLAAGHSLRTKLFEGLALKQEVGGVATSPEVHNSHPEVAISAEMMLEGPELVIRDPMNSLVGMAIKGLLTAQTSVQVCMCVHVSMM